MDGEQSLMNSFGVFYIYVQKQSWNKMEREFSIIYGHTKHFEFHIWIYTNFKAWEKKPLLNNNLPFQIDGSYLPFSRTLHSGYISFWSWKISTNIFIKNFDHTLHNLDQLVICQFIFQKLDD